MSGNLWYNRFRAVLQLVLMQSLLPFSLTFYALQIVLHALKGQQKPKGDVNEVACESDKKQYTIVLTGGKMTKSLHLARCLRAYADSNSNVTLKIVVLEIARFRYSASRFSKVVDHFEVISSPRDSPDGYKQGIYDACKKYGASHFLPVAAPVEAVYDAQVKSRLETELGVNVLHMGPELCDILDDKHRFCTFLNESLKIRSLRTYQVCNDDEAHTFNDKLQTEKKEGMLKRPMILKNLQYDPIHRLDLFQLPTNKTRLTEYLQRIKNDGNPITTEEPWQLQDFLASGTEYAAMIVVRSNNLMTMTCCPSSASQLNYVHIEVAPIRQWIDDFMSALKKSDHVLTGQLCFDFMVVKENEIEVAYPIECNPRVHTQCTVYNSSDARSLFGSLLLEPDEAKTKVLDNMLMREYESDVNCYWFYNEFFKILPNGWLFSYNGSEDKLDRRVQSNEALPQLTWQTLAVLLLFLPSICLGLLIASPVILCHCVAWSWNLPVMDGKELSFFGHGYVMIRRFITFANRLASIEDVEGDFWNKDPFPFIAKNHIQIPSRILATIKTGVEWKKLDFAIGKVVEVGGD